MNESTKEKSLLDGASTIEAVLSSACGTFAAEFTVSSDATASLATENAQPALRLCLAARSACMCVVVAEGSSLRNYGFADTTCS